MSEQAIYSIYGFDLHLWFIHKQRPFVLY